MLLKYIGMNKSSNESAILNNKSAKLSTNYDDYMYKELAGNINDL
jgi:hypothetical protein